LVAAALAQIVDTARVTLEATLYFPQSHLMAAAVADHTTAETGPVAALAAALVLGIMKLAKAVPVIRH
jgi:hypothetical protein